MHTLRTALRLPRPRRRAAGVGRGRAGGVAGGGRFGGRDSGDRVSSGRPVAGARSRPLVRVSERRRVSGRGRPVPAQRPASGASHLRLSQSDANYLKRTLG